MIDREATINQDDSREYLHYLLREVEAIESK
jgi:hypothetical protein